MITGTIEEVANYAERILASIAPGAFCIPQEWDRRIDCLIKLPDGSVVGEMVPLADADEKRIRETGSRLKQRQMGLDVRLHNELMPPKLICRKDSQR